MKHVPELDGLRGVAILLVLLYHFGARPSGVPRIFTAPFALGWSGVDLFFVLSGFLITTILIATRHSHNYFVSFYARRTLRIAPLYVTAVFLYFYLALPTAHHLDEWTSWDGDLEPWYWLHISNWQSAFGRDVPLLSHFWSLSIEEQFYLVWPVVVFVTPQRGLPWVCCALITISFALRAFFYSNTVSPEFLYRLTPFRLEPLAFGAFGAAFVNNAAWRDRTDFVLRVSSLTGIFLLTATIVFGRSLDNTHYPMTVIGYSSFSLIYSSIVVYSYVYSSAEDFVLVMLRNKFLMTLGKYSYGMYVFHFPLSYYQNQWVLLADGMDRYVQVIVWFSSKLLGIGVTFLIAKASWIVIEKRFIELKRYFPSR